MLDENGAAPGGVRAINIAPAIADEKAPLQIDPPRASRPKQHSRLWFPAIAGIAVPFAGVITNFDRVQGPNCCPQFFVHRFNDLPSLSAAADVWLICNDDQKETGRLQLPATVRGVRVNLEFVQFRRGKGETIADHGRVENAVAIEKDGAPFYFVLSHFVCAVFSAG